MNSAMRLMVGASKRVGLRTLVVAALTRLALLPLLPLLHTCHFLHVFCFFLSPYIYYIINCNSTH